MTEISTRDMRPHSRACGYRYHEHGSACSTNCPTCHGEDEHGEEGLLDTTDAQVWARRFCKLFAGWTVWEADVDHDGISEALMITWFANAIEIGRSAGRKETCPHADVITLTEELATCQACGTLFEKGVPG